MNEFAGTETIGARDGCPKKGLNCQCDLVMFLQPKGVVLYRFQMKNPISIPGRYMRM